MRIFSFILIGLGILLLASIGYDEYRGITHAPSSRYTGYSHYTITKQAKPDEFHNAMLVHLSRSFLLLLAGFVLFMIDRGQEKVDPMSADSDENIDEELRKDELDGEKNEQKEQSKHPKL
jgi:hypothetical protein